MEVFQMESPALAATSNRARNVKPSLGFNRPEVRGVAPAPQVSFSDRESDDHYRAIVAILNDKWRVIQCRDGIQWILQFAKKSRHGAAWRGRSYCRTRLALIAVCARHAGEIDPVAMTILEALPDITGGAK